MKFIDEDDCDLWQFGFVEVLVMSAVKLQNDTTNSKMSTAFIMPKKNNAIISLIFIVFSVKTYNNIIHDTFVLISEI